MKSGKHSKAVKRFGPRYGKRTRERLSKVETVSKATHKCPYCNYVAVKKIANGIFSCNKCSSKFTGKAYSPVVKKVSKQKVQKEVKFEDELFTKKEPKKGEEEKLAQEARETVKSFEKGDVAEEDQEQDYQE